MHPEWWSWIVGGIVLMLVELATVSLFVIWFGLGALLVGLLMLVIPDLSTTAQVAIWTIASLVMVALWFRVFKQDRQAALVCSDGSDVIGEIGVLVAAVEPLAHGKVRFQRPVLGFEEWACLADTAIAAGERVKVVAVEGSFLKINKA